MMLRMLKHAVLSACLLAVLGAAWQAAAGM